MQGHTGIFSKLASKYFYSPRLQKYFFLLEISSLQTHFPKRMFTKHFELAEKMLTIKVGGGGGGGQERGVQANPISFANEGLLKELHFFS